MIEPYKHQHQEYIYKGVKYPSVTQILSIVSKPYLTEWANKLGMEGIDSSKVLSRAASIGTLAHALIQGYLSNEQVSVEGYHATHVVAAKNALASFVAWYYKNKPIEVQALEKSIVSPELGYGGTLDAVLVIRGVPTLVDFKTSRSVHKEYFAQLEAYRALYELDGTHTVERQMILQLGTGAKPSYTEAYLNPDYRGLYWRYFKSSFALYKDKQAIDELEVALERVE